MDRLIKSTSGETTGMSRSGRVLKKSTKLTDFESPDEIDTRYKRRKDRSQKVVTSKAMSEDSYSFLDDEIIDVKEEPLEVQEWGEDPKEEEDSVEREERGEERDLSKDSDFLEMDDDYSDVSSQSTNYIQIVQDVDQEDEEENEVDFDDAASVVSSLDFEGFEEEVEHSDTVDGGGATETLVGLASHHRHAVMPITHHKLVTTTPHTTHLQLSSQVQYPYFSKKKGKKSIVMKNGQVVVRKKKTHRNDKAKARFTAYMLWAREVRQDIIRANPHMDFSAVNKRLGELWRLIPATKKYNYKRRAKRLTVKSKLKDELISTGPASCRPSLIQDNLIKKEKIKEVSLPDPKPALPLPTSSTQETGHHCNLQQKVTESQRKSFHLPEPPVPAESLDECPSTPAQSSFNINVPVLGKKCPKSNQKSGKKSPNTNTDMQREYHQPYSSKCLPSAHIPILENKCHKVEKELNFHVMTGCQCETVVHEDQTEQIEYSAERKRGFVEAAVGQRDLKSEEMSDYEDFLETESADIHANLSQMMTEMTDSSNSSSIYEANKAHTQHFIKASADGSCTNTNNHQQNSASEHLDQPSIAPKVTSFTMNEIYQDLFNYMFECPYCPLTLAQAMSSMLQMQLSEEKASLLYCVSRARLNTCLSNILKLQKMFKKNSQYSYLLEEMRKYPTNDAVIEWLLRMRRMGRPPVKADAKQVFYYLRSKYHKANTSIRFFLKNYGEKEMSCKEWAVLSPLVMTQWRNCFHDHVYVRCGMTPNELLTSKNNLQVFTSAEVLVSLDDFPREITVTRGKSNLYCLTQKTTGVSRAILTFSAAGQFHPPTILQKGYDLPHWALTEDSVDLVASTDGRLDPLVFLGWLRRFEQRLTEAGISRPVVLFVHGHAAHGSPAVESFCCAKGIILHSHHHSPINHMDPFIYLLSPLLHHFGRTQEQLSSLTGTHPLPDYLLPSILADAWSQVFQEKLAKKAFQSSGLVPYDNCFPVFEESIQVPSFPPLKLKSLQAYFSSGHLLEEIPFDAEPQITSTYRMMAFDLCKKPLYNLKDIAIESTYETPSCTRLGDKEKVSNTDQMHDPLYIGPDPAFDPPIMEFGKIIHLQKNMNAVSLIDHSSENSTDRELHELPLSSEIQEPGNWPELCPTSLSSPQHMETEPHLNFNHIHVESSKENLCDSQPDVKEYQEVVCSSTDLESPIQDQPEFEVKTEIITPERAPPDNIDNHLWIKEETEQPTWDWEFQNDSEENNLMQSSLGKQSPELQKVFIKMETDHP